MIQGLLEPVFQPIVNQLGDIFAYEALMRIRGQIRSPAKMVKSFERTGYIHKADLAMLTRVAEILALTGTRPRIAVNVSIGTIEKAGDAYVRALIELAPYAQRLIVELTETKEVTDAAALLRFYDACRAEGFAIALDDCRPGHPYGDPKFIRKFKPQFVKIDGEYLNQCYIKNDLDWLKLTVDTALETRTAVIAEYVSSEALRMFSFAIGADYVQGFAIGLPAALPSLIGERYTPPLPAPIARSYLASSPGSQVNPLVESDVQLRQQMAALALTELINAGAMK